MPGEAAKLSCGVEALPESPLRFRWTILHADGAETLLKEKELIKPAHQTLGDNPVNSSQATKGRGDSTNDIKANRTQSSEPVPSPGKSQIPDLSSSISNLISHSHDTPLGNTVVPHVHKDVLNIVLNFTSDSITVLCSAQNSVGVQKEPCHIHLRQAEVPPLSLLTAVAAESPKSHVNCSSGRLSKDVGIEVTCLIDGQAKGSFRSFVLLGWSNHSLLVNTSR